MNQLILISLLQIALLRKEEKKRPLDVAFRCCGEPNDYLTVCMKYIPSCVYVAKTDLNLAKKNKPKNNLTTTTTTTTITMV